MRLGLEPIHARQRDASSFVTSIAEAIDLLDEAGLDDVGIMVDTVPRLGHADDLADIARRASTASPASHVGRRPAGRSAPTASLPGEGISRTRSSSSRSRVRAGTATLDVEIFSTPDVFWGLPADEAARRCYTAMRSLIP